MDNYKLNKNKHSIQGSRIPEDGTDKSSRNVGNKLPLLAA